MNLGQNHSPTAAQPLNLEEQIYFPSISTKAQHGYPSNTIAIALLLWSSARYHPLWDSHCLQCMRDNATIPEYFARRSFIRLTIHSTMLVKSFGTSGKPSHFPTIHVHGFLFLFLQIFQNSPSLALGPLYLQPKQHLTSSEPLLILDLRGYSTSPPRFLSYSQ